VYYVITCILSECYKAFEPHVTCLRKRPRERERKRKRKRAHHTLQHTLQHTLHHTLHHTLQHTTKHFSHTSHVCSLSGNVSSIEKYKRNLLNNPMKNPKDLYSANSQSPDSPSMCFLFYQKRPIFYPKSPFHKKNSILYGNKNKQHTSSQNAWK